MTGNILPRAQSNGDVHKSLINLNEFCQGDEAENYIVFSLKTISEYIQKRLPFLLVKGYVFKFTIHYSGTLVTNFFSFSGGELKSSTKLT